MSNKTLITVGVIGAVAAGAWYLNRQNAAKQTIATATNPATKNGLPSTSSQLTTAGIAAGSQIAGQLGSWLTDEWSNGDSTNSTNQG